MTSESSRNYDTASESAVRYDIKDAARYLAIAPSTLRYWEREGLVRSERNPANDYRQYSLHSLIDASEIAFYRQLGVPVKELKDYHALTIEALDDALARSDESIQWRMEELIAARKRIAHQRTLNLLAENLQREGLRTGHPDIEQLSEIDYENRAIWTLLVDQPWRYGLYIDAERPDIAIEAIVDASPEGDTLWSRDELGANTRCLEGLLRAPAYGEGSNAADLLQAAKSKGIKPACIAASYLVTAVDAEGGPRTDYYRAWIIGAESH